MPRILSQHKLHFDFLIPTKNLLCKVSSFSSTLDFRDSFYISIFLTDRERWNFLLFVPPRILRRVITRGFFVMILSSLYLRPNLGSGFFTRRLERKTVPGPESRSANNFDLTDDIFSAFDQNTVNTQGHFMRHSDYRLLFGVQNVVPVGDTSIKLR